MLADALAYLACPVCGSEFRMAESSLVCARSHSFDVARPGYVNLASSAMPRGADTAAMVGARAAFLEAGHYLPLAQRLAELAADGWTAGGCVVDAGGGTGYYLGHVLDALPGATGIVLDRSKYAARAAARVHPRAAAVVADVWQRLPLRDGAASVVLDVFAPRNPSEMARVLGHEGTLLVVTPEAGHLAELVGALGLLHVDEAKDERLAEQMRPRFDEVSYETLTERLALTRQEVARLVAMGPSAWHTHAEELDRAVAALPEPSDVTAAFAIRAYRRTAGG
jgi:23S rRNA (guanine745-N1)-methyltransferase/23S rRNA (guanine748-N1)-methyltransferase